MNHIDNCTITWTTGLITSDQSNDSSQILMLQFSISTHTALDEQKLRENDKSNGTVIMKCADPNPMNVSLHMPGVRQLTLPKYTFTVSSEIYQTQPDPMAFELRSSYKN